MAMLELNNNQIAFDSGNYLNIKSLVPTIQKKFPLNLYKIENFKINGDSIDLHSEHPLLMRPINDSDLIEVSIRESSCAQRGLINDFTPLICKIEKSIEICCCSLKEHDIIPLARLSKTIEAVDTFIESISYCLTQLPNRQDTMESLPIKELQIHLLSIIKAIVTAQKTKDTIMLTDLLEFELKDNLTQWKILIIPSLKQIKRS